jgi:hypothetical protein
LVAWGDLNSFLSEKEHGQGWWRDRAESLSHTPYADTRRNEIGVYPKIGLDSASAPVLAFRVVCGQLPYFAPELLA